MMTIGDFNIKSISIGLFSIKSIWIGNTKVWSTEDATALANTEQGGYDKYPSFVYKGESYEKFANCFIDYMGCPCNP